LGFNSKGQDILKECKTKSSIPIIMKAHQILQQKEAGLRIWDYTVKSTDVFTLAMPTPHRGGLEYTNEIIIM
jgi:hypothetical protein